MQQMGMAPPSTPPTAMIPTQLQPMVSNLYLLIFFIPVTFGFAKIV